MSDLADRAWTTAFVLWQRLAKSGFDPVLRRPGPLPGRASRALGRLIGLLAGRLPFPPARRAGTGGASASADPTRVVWMLWDDGEAKAPPLTRLCMASWRELNPGWEVRVLDRAEAEALVGPVALPPDAGPSHHADLIRVRLLARQGGVWADATCLCLRPLDAWLQMRMAQGVFAFARPAPERAIASWFLAARPGHPLMTAWSAAADDCWRVRGRTDHYFLLHHLFEWVLLSDRRLADLWAQVPTLPAEPAHQLQTAMREVGQGGEDPGKVLVRLLEQEDAQVQKLDWRLPDGGALLAEALAAAGRPAAGADA